MKVKICGITNLPDAVCACEAGADYLGLVFYPKSPRFVSLRNAARLVRQLRQVGWDQDTGPALVGLFVKEPIAVLNRAVAEIGVNRLQLYGEYRRQDLEALKAPHFMAIRLDNIKTARAEAE